MFDIFRSKETKGLTLVFDIRSSSVGAALFTAQENGVPKIIFSTREPVLQQELASVDKFLISTMKSLDSVAGKVFKAGLGTPKNIYCVLASPWYVSQIRIINIKKETPFVFSQLLVDDLIKQEMEKFKEEHLKKYVTAKQEIRIIELKHIKTSLNGYTTHNPIDQKVQEAEVTLFVSMCPEQVLRNMEEVIRKYFHQKLIKFSSFTFASFAVMHSMFLNQPDFLLVDIGGEVTDISMVKRGVSSESISFPVGSHFIVRGVAEAMSCSAHEAESYLSLLNAGHADPVTEKKMISVVTKLKIEWLKSFQESLANLSRDISVPYTIYLSADSDFMNFFAQVIEAEQFNQYTLTESKFKIIFLDIGTLHGVVEFGNDVTRDSFVMIDVSYINHFLIYPEKSGKI